MYTKARILELVGRDPEVLAAALARALNDEARWARCAERLAKVAHSSAPKVVDRIMRENLRDARGG